MKNLVPLKLHKITTSDEINACPSRIIMPGTFERDDVTPLIANEIAIASRHLVKQLRGRLRDASVSVRQGGVVIRGTTKSYYVKQLAQHAVMKRVSLPIAANEIEVQAYGAATPRSFV